MWGRGRNSELTTVLARLPGSHRELHGHISFNAHGICVGATLLLPFTREETEAWPPSLSAQLLTPVGAPQRPGSPSIHRWERPTPPRLTSQWPLGRPAQTGKWAQRGEVICMEVGQSGV